MPVDQATSAAGPQAVRDRSGDLALARAGRADQPQEAGLGRGFPDALIDELGDELDIESIRTILGDSPVNTRVVYDCFSGDPAAALTGLRHRLALVESGVRALRSPLRRGER